MTHEGTIRLARARRGRGLGIAAVLGLAVALGLALGSTALAAPPRQAQVSADDARASSQPVRLQVTVIEASRGEGGVAPDLERFARYFERSFQQFRTFRRLDAHSRVVDRDGAAQIRLPDGLELTLTHLGVDGGFVRLAMSLDGLKTTIKVKDGGLFFQAGRKHGDGILVLAIEATSERR